MLFEHEVEAAIAARERKQTRYPHEAEDCLKVRNMALDLRSDDVGQQKTGPLPRPRSEKQRDTPPSGEVSHSALAKSAQPTSPDGGLVQTSGVVTPAIEIEVIRATCKLRLVWPSNEDEDEKGITKEERAERKGIAEDRKALIRQFYDTQRRVARVSNTILRQLWLVDAAAVEEADFRAPKPWKVPAAVGATNWYQFARQVSPELATGIASAVSKSVTDKWRQVRFEALCRLSLSPPHYKADCPIPVRAQELKIIRTDEGYAVSMPLIAGRKNRVQVALRVRDSHQRKILAALVSGDARITRRDAKFTRDRRNRWFVTFSYKKKVERATGIKTASINRGIRWFLVGLTVDGERWDYSGHDIEAHLKQVQRRRRSYQNDWRASNRHGRGRTSALEPTERLRRKAANWRKTKLQTIARRFTTWLVARGVGRLYVEDFAGIRHSDPETLEGGKAVWDRVQEWACYQLLQRLISCCEEAGIEVWQVPSERISMDCPLCSKEATKDLRRWKLRCKCGYNRHLDEAAALNVLTRGTGLQADEDKSIKALGAATKK